MENKILTKQSQSFKMIIPRNVEEKIRLLCRKIWDTEWSGILFYEPTGEFEDNSLVIKCLDILLMDIGSSSYTEFNMSPDVISYMAQNPELLGKQTGLIHSHSTFKTFFSGTDLDTLHEEGADRNHFVSLIVNNKGEYTAAITRKVVKTIPDIKTTVKYLSWNNMSKSKTLKETKKESTTIEYFSLDIEIEGLSNIEDRIEGIKQSKIKSTKKKSNILDCVNAECSKYLGADNNRIPSVWESDDWNDRGNYPTLFEEENYIPKNNCPTQLIIPQKGSFKEVDPIIKHIANECLIKLVTGNITASADSKLDISNWIQSGNMDRIFEETFGSGYEGEFSFQLYVEAVCEVVFRKFEENLNVLVSAILDEIAQLPKSSYFNAIIDVLNTYV